VASGSARRAGLQPEAGVVNPFDLPEEARTLYERWRAVGYSREDAMERVERSGLVGDNDLVESFRRLGLSEAAARDAARGHDGGSGGSSSGAEQMFRDVFGLSEAEAKAAAEGRDASPRWGSRRDPADNPFRESSEDAPSWEELLERSYRLEERLNDLERAGNERAAREYQDRLTDSRWARLHKDP
jgi:hypothetical protein